VAGAVQLAVFVVGVEGVKVPPVLAQEYEVTVPVGVPVRLTTPPVVVEEGDAESVHVGAGLIHAVVQALDAQ